MTKITRLVGAMLAILLSHYAFSQDIIRLDNNDEIYGTIKVITPHFIKYVQIDDLHGNLSKVAIKDVACIIYQNGDKEVVRKNDDEEILPDPYAKGGPNATEIYWNAKGQPVFHLSDDEDKSTTMANKGRKDAKMQYKGYKGAKTGTLLTACLTDPVLGLIPAIVCASTPPNNQHLNLSHEQLMKDEDYRSGYKKEAARIKKQQVWYGYLIGAGIYTILLCLLITI